MEKFAVIKTGNKQYKVRKGETLKIDKLEAKEGKKLVFDKVLLKAGDGSVEIGNPFLDSKVEAEVKSFGREKKGIVFRYKPKKRYRKKKGYRQLYAEVKITSIK